MFDTESISWCLSTFLCLSCCSLRTSPWDNTVSRLGSQSVINKFLIQKQQKMDLSETSNKYQLKYCYVLVTNGNTTDMVNTFPGFNFFEWQ